MTDNRRRRRHRPTCAREGCKTKVPVGSKYPTCCTLCGLVCVEMENAENVCRVTGDTELWAAAVALNDALTEHRAQFGRVIKAAREAGITDEQWPAIKRGELRPR